MMGGFESGVPQILNEKLEKIMANQHVMNTAAEKKHWNSTGSIARFLTCLTRIGKPVHRERESERAALTYKSHETTSQSIDNPQVRIDSRAVVYTPKEPQNSTANNTAM
jgi:hypothetical protein